MTAAIHLECQPATLADIVGQPCVRHLQTLVKQPRSSCWLLEGPPGVGKTASVHALANELGCRDEWTGLWHVPCTDLGVDAAKELFRRTLRFKFQSTSGFTLCILEELEWLSPQCQRFLKDALDPLTGLPHNVIVVATSNDSSSLDRALLQRFRVLAFSNWEYFREASIARLTELWRKRNDTTPPDMSGWGNAAEGFSMRLALNHMEIAEASAK